MLGSTRRIRVLAYNQPVDMRKGFDGLAAVVTAAMKCDPLDGSLFVFVSKNRKRAKVLYWDGTGLCILAKRLERGKFIAPWQTSTERPLNLTLSELQLLLEGSEWVGRYSLSPKEYFLHASC
jgi:transposase